MVPTNTKYYQYQVLVGENGVNPWSEVLASCKFGTRYGLSTTFDTIGSHHMLLWCGKIDLMLILLHYSALSACLIEVKWLLDRSFPWFPGTRY